MSPLIITEVVALQAWVAMCMHVGNVLTFSRDNGMEALPMMALEGHDGGHGIEELSHGQP